MTSRVQKNQEIFLGEDFIEIQISAFLNERKAQNLAKGTIRYYQNNLKFFLEYLNEIQIQYISQITSNIIRDFLLVLADRGHNEGGVHGYFRAIKAFLRWYWDEVEPDYKNPIDKVKAPKVSVEPIEGISSEDINLVDSSILIRQGKGRKPRFVFIGKSTRKQLRRWLRFRKANEGALFINKSGDRISYTTLREIFRRLSLRANIPTPSPHDFRRAFCLECLRKGIDLLTISRLMGHTSLQLLSRYAKQTSVDLMDKYKSVIDD